MFLPPRPHAQTAEMVAPEALASQHDRWLNHPLRPFLHLWMLSLVAAHPCTPFFDDFLTGVDMFSTQRLCWLGNPREFSSLWAALDQLVGVRRLSTLSSFTAVPHWFLDVSERLSCRTFGDVSLANYFHIPLSPALTGVSKNRSTQYTPAYGSKSASRAWNHRVALEITQLHFEITDR